IYRRLRAPVGQRHVVLGGPALIGVSLDEQLELGVCSQRLRVRIEDLGVLGANFVPVEFETNVLELRRRRELPRVGSGGIALSVPAASTSRGWVLAAFPCPSAPAAPAAAAG